MASCKGTVEDDLLEFRPLCYGFCIRDFSVVTFILGFSLKLDIGDAKLWSLKSGGVWSTYSGVHVLEVFWNLYSGTWHFLDIGIWTLEFGHWSLDIGVWTLETIHWRLVESGIVKAWQGVEVCLWH